MSREWYVGVPTVFPYILLLLHNICSFNHKRLIIQAHLCLMIPHVHLMHISTESVYVCLWLCPLGSSDNTWWHTLGMIAVKQGNKTWIASTVAIVTPQPLTLQQQPVPRRWGRVYFFIVPQWVSHTKHEACVSQTCFLWFSSPSLSLFDFPWQIV